MFVDRRHVKRSDVGGWGLGTAVVHTWRTRWRGGECHGVAVVFVIVCLRVRATGAASVVGTGDGW